MIHELVFHKIMDNYTALQNDFVTTYTFSFCQIIFFSPLKRWKRISKSKYHLAISLIIKQSKKAGAMSNLKIQLLKRITMTLFTHCLTMTF